MKRKLILEAILLMVFLVIFGCSKKDEQRLDSREAAADKIVRQKYGKSLAELPVVKLVAISPHNTDIENEFEKAFSLHHAVEQGQKVDIEWRDVGGGSSAILQHLRNVYENSDHSGIDIV